MRPIKFRAWVKHTTDHRWEWAYEQAERRMEQQPHLEGIESDIREEFLTQWDRNHHQDERYTIRHILVYGDEVKVALDGSTVVRHRYDVLAIDQYTGLKDSKGLEIYEGDIVRFSRTKEKGKHKTLGDLIWVGSIQWDQEKCGFTFHFEFPNGGGVTSSLEWEDYRFDEISVEVIGNIHENPELLNVGGRP